MKDWLLQKEEEQKNLFIELLDLSVSTLKAFNINEKKELSIRVIFEKDDWLDGYANIEILQKDNDGDYVVKNTYRHSVYNTNKDIVSHSDLGKLMGKGLFTNTWFSLLDSSHSYDTTILLTDKEYVLENEDCEYRENKMRQTHTGFNVLSPQEKKKKIK